MTDKLNPLTSMSKEQILYQLLKKECGYYSAILEMTRQENEKLATHRPLSEINPILKQKKVMLSCIAEIESAMLPIKRYWQEKKERSDPISLQIKQELATMDQLLREILQLDLVSQKNLANHLEFLQLQAQQQTTIVAKPRND